MMVKSYEEGGFSIHDMKGPAGELLIGGGQVTQGYFQHDIPQDNEAFFTDKNGMRWFRTGDIVRVNTTTNCLAVIDRSQLYVLHTC